MNRIARGLVVVVSLFLLTQQEGLATDVGVTVKASTLAMAGAGVDVSVGLSKQFNVRANLNAGSFTPAVGGESDDQEGGGQEVEVKMSLMTVGALLDYHPAGIGFRLTAGLMLNNNAVDVTADVNESVNINDVEYRVSDLNGEVTFSQIAPYVGLGFGNAIGKYGNVHFCIDLGVMFQGSPEVDLSATVSGGNAAAQARLDADLQEEADKMEDDLSAFTVFPVLAVGVSYKF